MDDLVQKDFENNDDEGLNSHTNSDEKIDSDAQVTHVTVPMFLDDKPRTMGLKSVIDVMRALNYPIVEAVWGISKNDPNKELRILSYIDYESNDREGVVIRDGYPLNCFTVHPAVLKHNKLGYIDDKARYDKGQEILVKLKKLGYFVSSTSEGDIHIWDSLKQAEIDSFLRSKNPLSFNEYEKMMNSMVKLHEDNNLLEDANKIKKVLGLSKKLLTVPDAKLRISALQSVYSFLISESKTSQENSSIYGVNHRCAILTKGLINDQEILEKEGESVQSSSDKKNEEQNLVNSNGCVALDLNNISM